MSNRCQALKKSQLCQQDDQLDDKSIDFQVVQRELSIRGKSINLMDILISYFHLL